MSETDLLKLMLEATQRKKLVWNHVSSDRYEAEADGALYFIEHESAMLHSGSTAFTTMYRVGVAEALITFADGSEHVAIVEAILAAAFQDWAEHVRFTEQFRVEAAERLWKLIAQG